METVLNFQWISGVESSQTVHWALLPEETGIDEAGTVEHGKRINSNDYKSTLCSFQCVSILIIRENLGVLKELTGKYYMKY